MSLTLLTPPMYDIASVKSLIEHTINTSHTQGSPEELILDTLYIPSLSCHATVYSSGHLRFHTSANVVISQLSTLPTSQAIEQSNLWQTQIDPSNIRSLPPSPSSCSLYNFFVCPWNQNIVGFVHSNQMVSLFDFSSMRSVKDVPSNIGVIDVRSLGALSGESPSRKTFSHVRYDEYAFVILPQSPGQPR